MKKRRRGLEEGSISNKMKYLRDLKSDDRKKQQTIITKIRKKYNRYLGTEVSA